MESTEYMVAWGIYLASGVVVSVVSWKVLKRFLWRELAYLLQSLLMAIIFTPWYVLPEEEILAPALMVFMLDLITIDVTTSIRALIPLVITMLLGIVLTIILSIIYRLRRRRQSDGVLPDQDSA